MKNRIISGAVFVGLGGLIAAGPQYIFRICEPGEKVMRCFWTGRAEIGIGLLIALSGAALFFLQSAWARLGISISIALAGVLAALIPIALIGVCGMHAMSCRMLALPALIVLSILVVLTSAANIIWLHHINKREELAL